jgi:hypothetical protein
MLKRLICLMPTCALLAAGGCGTSTPSPENPLQTQAQVSSDKRVTLSPALKGVLVVTRVETPAASSGYSQVRITVRNLSKQPRRININVQWLGGNGDVLPLPYALPPWPLLGGETSPLTLTAPSPLAKDFRAEFVPAD